MSRLCFTALAVSALAGITAPTFGDQDDVYIEGFVDFPAAFEGYYDLVGQSAYIQQRTNSGTSGGQLDLVQSTVGFVVSYTEIFPEAVLTDYLTFGYFGVVDTHELVEIGLRADFVDQIIDTSIVMALQPGVGEGQTVENFNTPGYDEATLVAALAGGFDSPEFFAVLDSYGDQSEHFGTIGLPQAAVVGDTLDLIAFIGGPNGDEGVKIGEVSTRIERVVPSPGATAILGLAGIAAIRRRR